MRHVCKHPNRQGKHLRQALDFLRRLGASAIEVLQNRHLRLAWEYRGISFSIPLAKSDRSTMASPIWAIRSELRRAGFAPRAVAIA